MESCCVGKSTDEPCHKNSYGLTSKVIKNIDDYDNESKQLLSLRVQTNIQFICEYHENKYLNKYHHLFGNSCSDPFRNHKKTVTKGLRAIVLDHVYAAKELSLNLIPGKSLCSNCYSKIFVHRNVSEFKIEESDIDFIPSTETIMQVDSVCVSLGVSPASKIRKICSEKRQTAIESKVKKVSDHLRRNLEACFDTPIEDETEKSDDNLLTNEYLDLIEKLKEKCKNASNEEKIKIISLLPQTWPRKKISAEFNVSDRLIKLSRTLVKEQGILPDLTREKKSIRPIDEETIKKVIDFYEDDENSRICPGKKDCVTVKENCEKIKKQKRLILCNLNELFVAFKKAHPECKIQRSMFCSLGPKHCILVGSSGTHNVCVCIYHQNVKLMIDGAKMNVDYKDLIDLTVCNSNNYNCMMNYCDKCPGKQLLLDAFKESEEDDFLPENVEFKQWINTDKSEMITVIKEKEEFFECLAEEIEKLKIHHYVSKVQSRVLKKMKEDLVETECIVPADFSENFSFLVQDEIQGYHWVNDQATLHPFVVFVKDNDKLKSHCFCVLSDYKEHNTTAVHAFQAKVIEKSKEVMPVVKKVTYFSDGSGSQYKNRKNFINICNHKRDFAIEAEWHFFVSCHGKNAYDGVGGTTKREVSRASLQRTVRNQILNIEDMFKYCKENIKGNTYFFVKKEEVEKNEENLRERFRQCKRIIGTRKYHKFEPVSENKLRCYFTSKSEEFVDHLTTSIGPISLSL